MRGVNFFPPLTDSVRGGLLFGTVSCLARRIRCVRLCSWFVDAAVRCVRVFIFPVDSEFASTTGGTCAYWRYMYKVPVVATINHSTKTRSYLDDHDWLGKSGNRVLFELTESP